MGLVVLVITITSKDLKMISKSYVSSEHNHKHLLGIVRNYVESCKQHLTMNPDLQDKLSNHFPTSINIQNINNNLQL